MNDSSSQLNDSSSNVSFQRSGTPKTKKKVKARLSPQPRALSNESSSSRIASARSSSALNGRLIGVKPQSQVTQQTNSTLQPHGSHAPSSGQQTTLRSSKAPDNAEKRTNPYAAVIKSASRVNPDMPDSFRASQSHVSNGKAASSTIERSAFGDASITEGYPMSASQTGKRTYKELHYVDTPNRFGVKALVNKHEELRGQRLLKDKIDKYRPHSGQNDVLSKIMYSIEQEEKLQKQLKARIVTLNSIDREVELFDKEKELRKQLEKIKRETLELNIKYKQTDCKSNKLVQEQLQGSKLVEKLRSDIRATNKAFLSKRDKINQLNKQLETIQQRVDKFQSLVPLLHDRLETGAINQDFDSLIEFFKKIVTSEYNSKNQQNTISNQYKAQQDEIEKLIQTNEYVKKVLFNQRESNLRQEEQLQKDVQKMRDRKHEMVEEYELLYEKYQQVITAE